MLGNTHLRYTGVAAFVLLLLALCFAGTRLQANDKSAGAKDPSNQGADKGHNKKAPKAETAVDPAQYVGEETCKTCHED